AEHDVRHARGRLHLVDDRRPVVQPVGGRERWPQARLAAVPLKGIEECGLLAADVRAGSTVDDQFQVEAGAEDVGTEVAALVGGGDGGAQPAGRVYRLAAHVDGREVGPE